MATTFVVSERQSNVLECVNLQLFVQVVNSHTTLLQRILLNLLFPDPIFR